MSSSLIPESVCPTCGYNMDEATPAFDEQAQPKPGDLSICLNCGEMLEFDESLHLTRFAYGKLSTLDLDTQFQLMKVSSRIKERGTFQEKGGKS